MKTLQDCNILLINLDGLRKDKVDLCPTLKSLKEKSYYFSEMQTVSPYTFAALHAIFSGTYPSRNGVNAYYNIFKFKKEEIITLAELMKKVGYYTCCDVISESVMPKQGFDEWNKFDEESVDFKKSHKELIKRLSKKKKFFLFLHFTETHKYLVREIVKKYKQEDNDEEFFRSQEENEKRYNSYLPSTDDYITAILDTLKECNISDNTILVIFSDHGTSLGEKPGEKFYGVYVYDYTVNVFCILHIPKKPPILVDKQCRTIDIFPTIAEIAEIPIRELNNIQGETLFPLINNPNSNEREVFVETGGLYGPWPSPKKHNVFCVRKNKKKLIYNDTPQTWEFYDLMNDPKEKSNIYDENLEEVIQMKKRLIHYLKDNKIDTNIS